VQEVRRWLIAHLQDHYSLYGEYTGVRSARKHIAWYLRGVPGGEDFRRHLNLLNDSAAQVQAVDEFLDQLNQSMDRIPGVYDASGRVWPDAASHEEEPNTMKSAKLSLHHEQ
jgi:tRNA-dihydrouridine synthase B